MPPEDDMDFFEWFNSLDPIDQENFLYDMELGGANALPGQFGGPMAPQLDPYGFDLMSFGGGADLPEYTSKGRYDPYDLSQEAKRFNLIQDYASGSVDNALAMFAGPGAYDIDAFNDVVLPPRERAEQRGTRTAQAYAQGGGYEGYLAQKILQGATPSEAIADLMDLVNAPDSEEISPEDREARQALIASLPQAERTGPTPPGEEVSPYDLSRIQDFGTELFQGIMSDEQPVYVDPQTGIGYMDQPYTQRSEAAEWYDKRGLPLPTASYGDEEYQQAFMDAFAPDRQQDEAARAQEIRRTSSEANQALQASREAGRRYREFRGANATQQGFNVLARDAARPEVQAGTADTNWGPDSPVYQEAFQAVMQRDPTAARTFRDTMLDRIGSGRGTRIGAPVRYINERTQNLVPTPGDQQPLLNNGVSVPGARAPFNFGEFLAGGNRRPLQQTDVDRAGRERRRASDEFKRANTRRYQAERVNTSPTQANAAYALGMAAALARSGRTPLQDALMQRVLGQRAMGARGGF